MMYSVLQRILSSALIALVFTGMVFQATAEEAQTTSGEACAETVIAVETPADEDASEPSSDEIVAEEPQAQEPSVSVRANCDVSALAIGDSLVLTCELIGFEGLEYAIRWQARVNGQWKDLPGENSDTLVIRITSENADWAYRAAVDAQPA